MLPSTGDPSTDGESSGSGTGSGGASQSGTTCPPCTGSACNNNCALCSTANQNICITCKNNFALVSSNNCSTCGSSQYFKTTTQPCGQCPQNCSICSSSSSCSVCNTNYELNSSNNCQICKINNGQFYDSQKFQCGNCPSNCLTCNSSNDCSVCQSDYQVNSQKNGCQACLINQGQYYDSSQKICGQCPSSCLICMSSQDCSVCQQNYQLNSLNNGCEACLINQGQYYDSNTKTCINCLQNCLKCTNQSSCIVCAPGYYLDSNQCTKCSGSCLTCNGSSQNNCLSCSSEYFFYTNNSTCQKTCDIMGGFFIDQGKCSPCDQSCKTCNGPNNSQCITCATGLYKYVGDNLCKACPATLVQTTVINCNNSSQQCLYNNQTKSYELITICLACNQGYSLINNICVDSCSLISQNYYLNVNTNQCECSFSFPYKHIKQNNSIFCSSFQQLGYFCDNNKICHECSQLNCQTCQDQNTCTLCSSGYYLWLNECLQSCPSSRNLQISNSKAQCECIQDYILINPDNICVTKLIITQINLSKNSDFNIITVTFNRVPYPNELKGLSIQLDPGKLTLNTDYQIVSQQQVSNTITFNISVEQNRRVNEIVVYFGNQKEIFKIQNAILTTNNYNNSQQNMQAKIDSATNVSKVLVSGKGNGYIVILILKQFQILCFFSNFIQFFGPLILFKQFLPKMVYVGTILASSFIFNSIPDANQLSANIQNDTSSQTQVSSEQNLLQDLGLQENLYSSLPLPNISLIITIIIVVLCCFARWIMKGKYTTDIKDNQSFVGFKFIINNSLIPEDFYIEKQNILDLMQKSTQDLSTSHELFLNKDEKLLLDTDQLISCIKDKTKCQFFYPLRDFQNKSLIKKLIYFGDDFTLNKSQDKMPKQMNSIVHHYFGTQKEIKSQKIRILLDCTLEGCNNCVVALAQNVCKEECIPGYYSIKFILLYKCKKCDQSCLECDGEGPNKCTSCNQDSQLYQNQCCQIKNGEFYNSKTNQCEKCPQNCQICYEPNICNQCKANFEFDQLKQCVCPQSQQYFDDQTKSCLDCDKSCKTCKQTSKSCTSCQDFQFLNTQSLTCQNSCDQAGFYALEKNCLPCDSACLTCSISSKNCTSCKFGQFLNIQSQTCIDVCPTNGFYIEKQKCITCDSSCSTCSESSKCTTCAQNLYRYGGDNLCKPCHETSLNPAIISQQMQNCAKTIQKCLLNLETKMYELTSICQKCKGNFVLANNKCINHCSDIAQNYEYNNILQQCQCSSSNPYQHNQSNNNIFCYKFQLPGYYCDSNKICDPCLQPHCEVCNNQQICTICLNGHYLWQNDCLQTCESSKGLEPSQSKKECICIQDYIFYAPRKICILQLQISQIQLTKDIQYNIITVIFNRAPYTDELKTIRLIIDPPKLIQSKDYTIISQQQNDNNIIFQVSVQQNIKISQIVINYNNKQSIYQVQNTILTSDYVNNNLQNKQSAINNVKSLGQSLSTQEGLLQSIINILKNFQILCLLSNFVQLLGPLIVFKEQLPQPIYTGALLGASFIFTEIPSPDELSTNSNTTSNEDIDNHKKLLQQLGFKDNIYQNLALPHLLLIISVIISLLCLFARQVIEGKQYTITVVNFLVNIMSQLHQGYITCTLLSIYYSLEYSSQKQYAIMQLQEDGEAI
ncbi:transmembrane protein, putative (macronuclear) [Tetrahymena thermophila SB210]|uniref:Transmembrane protein, putative n=1 Tax=Tetrahymena thermophila (strain SB210) TaxID=312017 RepID=Q234N4_TETTS|nr:transmembrane protein, putative [Tetrahymena thermophila SB210]EAR91969.3 transmembrane protein, putative [Tetrahymena thermophila SB210]|eukprot:XP_001012214.3 transmembrane protein, putative [Tetrahymena thermophila SB210]